ncbi:hypothetical protein [Tahibacter sp.]|uniref:hypothetical protein n=1 Tax=Tahibacter sp. TaxID=2056211 RepID=UPI0028C38CB5|nr:hypothetical protein [Tahibacter sp.]
MAAIEPVNAAKPQFAGLRPLPDESVGTANDRVRVPAPPEKDAMLPVAFSPQGRA